MSDFPEKKDFFWESVGVHCKVCRRGNIVIRKERDQCFESMDSGYFALLLSKKPCRETVKLPCY